ncbi:DUF4148 domain-containing protein [Paraburkholderia sp. DHOC27]|uniref:DUF4148 domain-containing protein n=1 Tax=Paraburkholderia sp. DHOC27 TaxID=2303330 RepID=UPI000E3C1211|nr:DUF4148 domain-containing protein [Paraburkholderia sp. DHOC27]RFU44563.1 DUF4148 domain-containing protein [Paraburkholderia sp. DHOC27]
MKTLALAVLTASSLALPLASFAQSTPASNAPLTRAEVKAQLVQLEQAGYNPSAANDATYPAQIQAAEARVAAQNAKQEQGYGSGTNGSTQSGVQATPATPAAVPANSGQ